MITGNNLVCAHCHNTYLHPHAVHISSAADGDPPHEHFKVSKPHATMIIESGLGQSLGLPSMSNRAREMDVVLRFWCEGCHKLTRVEFAFHKGETLFAYGPCEGRMVFNGEDLVEKL